MFADIGNVPAVITKTGDGDGGAGAWGASGMWLFALVIIFLALAFFGGGGLGGRREVHTDTFGAAPAAFTELNARLDSIQREVGHNNDLAEMRALYTQACATDMNVTQQAFNVSNLVNQTRTDTLLNMKDAALQLANCCCDTNRNIDNVRFQGERNTCDIIAAGNSNTQQIIDKLTQSEITRLRDELSAERLANSQCTQNAYLINTLRPYPTPAFSTFNPAVPYAMV